MTRLVLALLALALAAACSDPRPPPQPASFSRPTDVDFVCVSHGRVVVSLHHCDDDDANHALHAVVTQSARGEVAAVNLESQRILDNRREVPGYTFVPAGELPIAVVVPKHTPEFTYVANYGSRDIHVLRTAVLVSLSSEAPLAQRVDLSIEADGGAAGGAPTDMILTPDQDALLVTLPDLGQVLRLPLLDDGLIDEDAITTLQMPLDAPVAAAPVEVDETYSLLCGYERPAVPAVAPQLALPAATAARPVALTIDRSCDGTACAPRVLVADEALPVLHVIDLAALAAGGSALLAPIATGAPTRAVVVTPRVPKFSYEAPIGRGTDETDDHRAEREARDERQGQSTYFVYAIDATDGSVIALENDQVLAVNHDSHARADRVPVAGRDLAATPNALALEVVTPLFDLEGDFDQQVLPNEDSSQIDDDAELFCTDANHEEITPRRLRGVFLTVAMGDGTVRVIDVHDMELGVCRSCPSDIEGEIGAPVLMRHHPRLTTNFVSPTASDREQLKPFARALYQVEGVTFPLRANGTTSTPDAPGLECIACDDGRRQAFPDPEDQELSDGGIEDSGVDGGERDAGVTNAGALDAGAVQDDAERSCTAERSALVCATPDPWVLTPEELVFVFEATIPSTQGGDGRFALPGDADNQTGALELIGNIAFCNAGVLGASDIAAARDEASCHPDTLSVKPDQLVIRSVPLSEERLRELGDERLQGLGENLDQLNEVIERCQTVREALASSEPPIIAFDVLAAFEDRIAISPGLNNLKVGLAQSYFDVIACFGAGPYAFDVRTQGSFAVSSTRQGFAHHVVPDDNGRCVVDPAASPLKTGRAWPGCMFRNERTQLKLGLLRDEMNLVVDPPVNALLDIQVSTNGGLLSFDARQPYRGVSSIIPSRLRYSETNRELYLVDTHLGGLIPITLDPFPSAPTRSFY